MDLKGIVGDLGMMNITLKPNAKLVKQRPYHFDLKYKEKAHVELGKMLTTVAVMQSFTNCASAQWVRYSIEW